MQLVENAASDVTDDKFVQSDILGKVNQGFIDDVSKTLDKIMSKIVFVARS